jgi:hypothetical protein
MAMAAASWFTATERAKPTFGQLTAMEGSPLADESRFISEIHVFRICSGALPGRAHSPHETGVQHV